MIKTWVEKRELAQKLECDSNTFLIALELYLRYFWLYLSNFWLTGLSYILRRGRRQQKFKPKHSFSPGARNSIKMARKKIGHQVLEGRCK